MKINVEYIDTREEEQILSTQEQEALLRAQNSLKKLPYLAIKRLTDIIFACLGLVFMLPLMLVVKIGNLITGDTAPIFYKTTRIGKNGKHFNFYKFRSMVVTKDGKSAEALLEETLNSDPALRAQWEKYRKLDNDPRITKMGKFIRKTSIDEFPQFWSVLKGDMSLIGPRPLMIGELDENDGDHERYESMRPGITGWWAANGRSKISYQRRLALEYWYTENASTLVDLECIWRTLKTMLVGSGSK